MKRNNLKVLATCLIVLVSLAFLGCARQPMMETMDKTMEAPKQQTMGTMQAPKMEEPMQETADQKMGGEMDEMKGGTAMDTMDGPKDPMMK